ncbi:thiosulfate oxidation carrier complex protein SoxZ [Sedimenticola selenatireducens]|uniref:Thiosulfate oxidation carrier complex protein SoxZ n=1 Tax=Sedimenticola selenatireducens TaxID=191960 RepID=A0A2N6CYU0_9GAMM|nr:thiosulfate oxidation carrier complex protein SoxZ [Sedimenticola selenatireducens]PLX62543.1 MAG: thiosulfate oxidation carrier complex protein SoxZ [Sedimenticola selenatireducens]
MATIKIRAKEKDGVTTVKALMTHPMESGFRKDSKSGGMIPAHYIQEVVCEVGGKMVMNAHWSGGVSKNHYLSFKFDGGKGETLKLTWTDNQGKSDSVEEAIG